MTAEKIYIKPSTIDEAVSMAYAHKDDFCYVAGGTDVLVNKYQGNKEVSCLIIDISDIAELKSIESNGTHVKIGALVRLA
jgi:CO/xanthine dehydrogenase FAD-binding subunit